MTADARHILIVPDKFKGTLTAAEAAASIAAGWRTARPQDTLELLPMADGGDGFGEIFGGLIGAVPVTCDTVDAAARPRHARWWWSAASRTAILEAAEINGLARLPAGQYHPFALDTYGLGAVLQAISAQGVQRLYVGIGGSATNDGGFGMARALGWHFFDAHGATITRWTQLDQLIRVAAPATSLPLGDLIIAVDVTNPLLGPQGASRIYGPQKGLRAEDMAKAEACLQRLAEVMHAYSGGDMAQQPGAGAAGGLGFGLHAFCAGRFQSGAEIFAQLAQLEARIAAADIVVTGEGSLDAQSLMGKGTGVIAEAAARAGKRCLCLAAVASAEALVATGTQLSTHTIVPDIAPRERALARPAQALQQLAHAVAARLD